MVFEGFPTVNNFFDEIFYEGLLVKLRLKV